jgi:hypothetical protein
VSESISDISRLFPTLPEAVRLEIIRLRVDNIALRASNTRIENDNTELKRYIRRVLLVTELEDASEYSQLLIDAHKLGVPILDIAKFNPECRQAIDELNKPIDD